MKRNWAAAILVALATSAVSALGTVDVQTNENTASASIQLPPNLSVDFSIAFEHVSGLSAQNLGLTAGVIDPTNAAFLARLPQGASIPTAFPVLIAVEPPSTGSLSFNGIVTIALHTANLSWTQGTPLRLLAAPLGGNFVDITSSTGSGSYRAGANKGGFSEFIVASDLRTVDAVISDKFDRLQYTLSHSQAISSSLSASLQAQLDSARASLAASNPGAAADKIDDLAQTVLEHSGTDIPDVWRASRDVTNVAGELRSGAATLSYSLRLKASSP